MLEKIKAGLLAIKNGLVSVKTYLVEIMAAVIGLLIFYITLKNKQIASLNASIELVKTQKEADVLEGAIKDKLNDSNLLQKEIDSYNASLNQLQQKRANLTEGSKTDDPTNYWKNN